MRKAIELVPKFAKAHASLGLALAGKGRVDEAIACFRQAIEEPSGRWVLTSGHCNRLLLGQNSDRVCRPCSTWIGTRQHVHTNGTAAGSAVSAVRPRRHAGQHPTGAPPEWCS